MRSFLALTALIVGVTVWAVLGATVYEDGSWRLGPLHGCQHGRACDS